MEQGWSPLIPVIPFKSSDPPSNDLRHTFASLLLSCNVLLLYVSKQLGHAKPTTTLDHYAKWLPSGEQRFVNVLDTQLEKVGTMSWHQVDITEKEESEVVEKFGGPCRGRTYGPLIKSLSSNSKCNTTGPDGLGCCHAKEILSTHECRRT